MVYGPIGSGNQVKLVHERLIPVELIYCVKCVDTISTIYTDQIISRPETGERASSGRKVIVTCLFVFCIKCVERLRLLLLCSCVHKQYVVIGSYIGL